MKANPSLRSKQPKVLPAYYAYGVEPMYGSPNGEAFAQLSHGMAVFKPYSFLHYWIDEGLNYHECLKPSGKLPRFRWVVKAKWKVELVGPRNYTITMT